MPTTGWPDAHSASVRWLPMKPAAPVTTTLTGSPLRLSALTWSTSPFPITPARPGAGRELVPRPLAGGVARRGVGGLGRMRADARSMARASPCPRPHGRRPRPRRRRTARSRSATAAPRPLRRRWCAAVRPPAVPRFRRPDRSRWAGPGRRPAGQDLGVADDVGGHDGPARTQVREDLERRVAPASRGRHQHVGRPEAGGHEGGGHRPTIRTRSATPSSSASDCSVSTWSGRPPATTSRASGWLRDTATIDSSRSGTPW